MSVVTAALIALVALSTLISYMAMESRKIPLQYSRLTQEVLEELSGSLKTVSISYNTSGLYLMTSNPPVKVVGIISLDDSGYRYLSRGFTVNSLSTKLLPYEVVNSVLSSGGAVVVITEGLRYYVIDRYSVNEFQTLNSSVRDPSYDLVRERLRPTLLAGAALSVDSFLSNPVPGYPTDPEANYVPIGVAYVVNDYYSISKDWWYVGETKSEYGLYEYVPMFVRGSTSISYLGLGYYLVNASHSIVKCESYIVRTPDGREYRVSEWKVVYSGVAGYVLYPFLISRSSEPFTVYFGVSTNSYVRPALYAVDPADVIKGGPVAKASDINLESTLRYSVVRPLYSWEGVRLYGQYLGFSVTVDPAEVFKSLPPSVNEVVALVGFLYACSTSTLIKFTAFLLGTEYEFYVGSDEVGKILLIPAWSNVIPEVRSPSNTSVTTYRPYSTSEAEGGGGTSYTSSLVRYVTWFKPSEVGRYVIKYVLGSYNSLPLLGISLSLAPDYSPSIEYSTFSTHLTSVSDVNSDEVCLEPDYVTLRDQHYYAVSTEGWGRVNEVTYRMVITSLPPDGVYEYNFRYYGSSGVSGTASLTKAEVVYVRDRWYSYWNVYLTPVDNGTTKKLDLTAVPQEPFCKYNTCYLGVYLKFNLVNVTLKATPVINGVKYTYKVGSEVYVTYITPTLTHIARINNSVLIRT